MNVAIAIIVGRLFVAAIFCYGAVLVALSGKDGWGWFIFAAICFGCVSYESTKK